MFFKVSGASRFRYFFRLFRGLGRSLGVFRVLSGFEGSLAVSA